MPNKFNTDTDMIIFQNKNNISGINIDVIPGFVMTLDGKIIIHKQP